jgi:metal-sulfur cluster biosynthetic enzyme
VSGRAIGSIDPEAGRSGPDAAGVPILHPGAAGIAAALRRVVDPEVGLDVVRLGLVYNIEWTGEGVRVVHTFTTPGCPLAGHLERAMRVSLERLPHVGRVELRYTDEPAWHPDMIRGWG